MMPDVSRPPQVTLTQLRYFVEAARQLSMTRAADELHVAQSAVSAAVSQLERQVGTPLFLRQHARGLVLTAAGEELLHDVRGLLAHLGEVLDAARGRGEDVRGTIRLAFFVTLVPFILPDLLVELRDRHPHLEVEVLELEAAAVSEALRSGTAEVALCYDLGLGPGIESTAIADAPPYILLPPGHRLVAEKAIDLRDLDGEPMVLLDLPHSRDYFRDIFAGVGVEPEIVLRTSSYEAVRGLVARGHGFSMLNQRPRHDATYGGGEVVCRPITDEVRALQVVTARMAVGRPTARARAVTDAARDVIARGLQST